MSDRKPLVLAPDRNDSVNPTTPVLQQINLQDQVDPVTLPLDRETNLRRLFRALILDLMKIGFPLSQELIDEASKQT